MKVSCRWRHSNAPLACFSTTTVARLTSLLDLPKLYRTIDADPAIVGAGVVHIGSDYQVTVLREFVPLCVYAEFGSHEQ